MTFTQQHELTQEIKTEAHRLGFSLAGVTHPGATAHFSQYLAWLDAGRHAGMAYLATERGRALRGDPGRVLPGCRSILVLAVPYESPQSLAAPSAGALHGRVAAYAWGEDYHLVLAERLQTLGEFITHLCGAGTVFKGYTDTGPVLERDLAQRAGLGWIGRNTCLINPHKGSYFFLAELFLNLTLEEDVPYSHDSCGACQKCIQACPTGCIQPDRTLDARRCIAYLTIENKGDIPEELRPLLGNWVFGCDICQMVCPWNERLALSQRGFASLHGDAAFAPRPEVAFPILSQDLRQLAPQAFNDKFDRSPIQRARRRGYLRNLTVAASNSHDWASIPALERLAASEEDALVRGAAVQALRCLENKK